MPAAQQDRERTTAAHAVSSLGVRALVPSFRHLPAPMGGHHFPLEPPAGSGLRRGAVSRVLDRGVLSDLETRVHDVAKRRHAIVIDGPHAGRTWPRARRMEGRAP